MKKNEINHLRRIMNKHDPQGIYHSDKVNFDEYDSEIRAILKKYRQGCSRLKFKFIVYGVFLKFFGLFLLDLKKLNSLANELYIHLNKINSVKNEN